MSHALLVFALKISQFARVFIQRLTESTHVSMPEDCGNPLHKLAFFAVQAYVLIVEKTDKCLRHRHLNRTH